MARLRIIACIFALFLGGRAVAEPRVAVIGSPSAGVEKLLPLVELRLAKQPGLALLEREKISEVFREQELSALTAAEGTAKRVALGKLLKADVLVVLRGEEKPIPHAWVVICETRQGLRLCNQPVECGTKVEDRAEAVLKLVERALAKHGGQIKEIVAVPPLVSNDLGFESQAQQKPLANVIEQSLLTRPQVLSVELAEAKAVADELAVSGDEDIQRRLPLYLIGEFRHQENGTNVKLTFHLKLMRGQKLVGERELKDVVPADLANALRREAAFLLDKAMETTAMLPDPATEAQQLAQRAIVLYQLMNFCECLELCEASLLLKPDQTDIHRLAAHSAGMHVSMLLRKAADKPVPYGVERLKQAIMHENADTLRRGLPHLEYFMEHAAISATRDRVLILGYFQCCQEIKEIRPMVLRVLAAKLKAGVNDDTIMFVRRFRPWGFQGMTADEILRWKLEAAKAWPRADAQGILNLVDVVTYGTDGSDSPELREICKRLREISNPAGPGAAEFMEIRWRAGHVANPDVLAILRVRSRGPFAVRHEDWPHAESGAPAGQRTGGRAGR
ncbi:MAG: hypothetical protein WCJ35_11985 [Planctomycetota bacterium]